MCLQCDFYFVKKYVWNIDALDDESLTIVFHSFQSFDNHHICFHLSNALETSHICTNEQFPVIRHHVGSWSLAIEPEFIWILVQYHIQIDRAKKGKSILLTDESMSKMSFLLVTNIYQIDFDQNHLILPFPNIFDPFVHIEWSISQRNVSSMIIFDIENVDGNTPADLFIVERMIDIENIH